MALSNSYPARRRVLVADDQPINRELLGTILSDDYDVLYAENGAEALACVRENAELLSLILIDLIMPELDGFAVLGRLRADETLRRIPVIVLTADESAELRSLQLGAADFITKPFDMHEVILARVARIIELSEGRRIIQAAEKDELTGLYTGNFFLEYAQRFERYHPDWEMDALVLNVERFHLVNELYGRDFGDRVLRLIARRIRQFLETTEGIACRAEADTFYIYCMHQEDYAEILKRIRDGLAGVSQTVRIRLRLGVFRDEARELSIERQIERAKIACGMLRGDYARSILIYDNALHRRELYAQSLINDIHRALDQKQLQLYYQPKYDITGDKPRLLSAEALVRWAHPEYGMIPPGDFIPLFEKNGLIQLVDYYIWREASAQIRRWRDSFGVKFPLSVNVSRIDIYDPNLSEKFDGILEDYGLSPSDLLLEISEVAYADDSEQLIESIERLRARGFQVGMDDFGSGYSSLSMLFTLPIDVLKLDMKFVRNLRENSKSYRLVELIMDIAKYLAVPVVAEGVETEEQCRLLKQLGCRTVQGYYFAKPETPEELSLYFKNNLYL